MTYRKNDEFETEITDLGDDGSGIGRTDGFTWFIKDAVIGDRVIASAMKLKKTYGYARLLRVTRPSPLRIEAPCPAARACGGCQLQQLSYEAQLRFKEEKVLGCLERIGGVDLSKAVTEPIIGMPNPYRYRNKAIYPVGKNKDGRLIAGFYAGHTHSIIDCQDCLLGAPENRAILNTVLRFMERKRIEPYDEVSGRGTVRHIMLRKGFNTGETMVCIVINADDLKGAEELGDELIAKFPEIKSFSLCINKKKTNVIMGDRVRVIRGSDHISEEIDGLRFSISPLSFFQVNSEQMARLYGTALEFAALNGSEKVWDLYCGVGTISLFLARHAKKVYGVEVIPDAIADAKENARINGITNVDFYVGRAEEVLPGWYENGAPGSSSGSTDSRISNIDVVVVDPPRRGCDEKCLETIVKAAPCRVVYVSCDPATLARDVKYLSRNGYSLERVRPCDMFPNTVHVETVVLMSRVEK